MAKQSWPIPKIWEGGQCFILGGGGSLPRQFGVPEEIIAAVQSKKLKPAAYSDYMTPIHDQHVIGVNAAMLFGNWIDVLFFGDGKFLKLYKTPILKFQGLRITSDQNSGDISGKVKYVKKDRVKKHGICYTPNTLCWNGNSGAAAINLAVHFGVKRIILLGFDMDLDSSRKQHWHGLYRARKDTDTVFKRHLVGFSSIAFDTRHTVEIINANPKSKITAFPRIDFKDIKL